MNDRFARVTLVLATVAAAACASPRSDADTTAALPPVDTFRAAMVNDSQRIADSISLDSAAIAIGMKRPPAAGAGSKSAAPRRVTRSQPSATPTVQDSTQRPNPNIGRDSVIRRTPRRMPADTSR